MEHRRVVAMLVMCGVLLRGAIAPSWTGPAPIQSDVPFDEVYSLESRTAIGAHPPLLPAFGSSEETISRTPRASPGGRHRTIRAFGWERSFEYEVDEKRRRVTVSSPTTMPRTAVYNGDQGCTILARGEEVVSSSRPRSRETFPTPRLHPGRWAMPTQTTPVPAGVDTARVNEALEWAMRQEAQNTRSIVVVYDGKIIVSATRPAGRKTRRRSAGRKGKSITSALIGVLVEQGEFAIDDFAPIEEWRKEGDLRGQIGFVTCCV